MGTPGLQDFTLPIYYLRHIADQIGSMGADRARWLEQNQLTEAQLADVTLDIPFAAFRKLILDALDITREPALGLLVGERLGVNTHGIVGYAALNSGTLRQVVEMFERFMRLRTPLVTTGHELHGDQFRIVFTEVVPLGDIHRPLFEAVVLSVKNLVDAVTLGSRHVSLAAFGFAAPGDAALAHDLFRCEVRYGQAWTGFALPLEVVDLPLKMTDPTTFAEAALICQRELEKLAPRESLGARVRRLMLDKQNGFPSLQVTARLFHLTPRTLHRRLLQEGTSFQLILDDARHRLALEHLKTGSLSLQEIAWALGYTDLANFRRAFKRWEGLPPSGFRANI
jgi:AraC-like DNA-binding protein